MSLFDFFLGPKLLTAADAAKKTAKAKIKIQKDYERQEQQRQKKLEFLKKEEKEQVKKIIKEQINIVSRLIKHSIDAGTTNLTHYVCINHTFLLEDSRKTVITSLLAFLHDKKYKAEITSPETSYNYIIEITWGSDIKPNEPIK